VRLAFDRFLGQIADRLTSEPLAFRLEPPEFLHDGWQFRKVRGGFPHFKNDAKYIRLMFLVHPISLRVVLVRLYTHAQYTRRPPDAELLPLLEEIVREYRQKTRETTDPSA
jgi:hypothetical protein